MKLSKYAILIALFTGYFAGSANAQNVVDGGLIEGPPTQYASTATTSCASAACDHSCDQSCDGSRAGSFRLRYGFDIGLRQGIRNFTTQSAHRSYDLFHPRGIWDDPFVRPGCKLLNEPCNAASYFGGWQYANGQLNTITGPTNAPYYGGWLQVGYHSKGASGAADAPGRFNDNPRQFNLNQLYFFAEKKVDGCCGCDWGYRFDAVLGSDAPNVQSFNGSSWDNGWDIGSDYGVAVPQLYAQAAYGPLSVKFGHFYKIVGYEFAPAPQNFFYSHSLTMTNSEPYTHTGFLAQYEMTRDLTLYGGYSMGWDGGLDNNGDNFIGGFSWNINPCSVFTLTAALGRINEHAGRTPMGNFPFGGFTDTNGDGLISDEAGYDENIIERGNLFSAVYLRRMGRLTYVGQMDWLSTKGKSPTYSQRYRKSLGVVNYLFYTLNDNWSVGSRVEWWQVGGSRWRVSKDSSIIDITMGANYRHASNLMIRPEVRWTIDGNNTGINQNFSTGQTTFGLDAIYTF